MYRSALKNFVKTHELTKKYKIRDRNLNDHKKKSEVEIRCKNLKNIL